MTNWQLIITLAALVVAIFGAGWLNQRAIERQMEAFRNEMGAFKDAITAEMTALRADVAPVRAEVEQLKQSVAKIDRQFEAIFSKLVLPKYQPQKRKYGELLA
ncbi:MAG: hypothetical protein ACREBD_11835 [Blastocatellia bacterium]